MIKPSINITSLTFDVCLCIVLRCWFRRAAGSCLGDHAAERGARDGAAGEWVPRADTHDRGERRRSDSTPPGEAITCLGLPSFLSPIWKMSSIGIQRSAYAACSSDHSSHVVGPPRYCKSRLCPRMRQAASPPHPTPLPPSVHRTAIDGTRGHETAKR
jgi:hypothetical protein